MTKSEQLLTKSYKQPRNFDITVIVSQKWLIESVVSSFQDVLETLMMNTALLWKSFGLVFEGIFKIHKQEEITMKKRNNLALCLALVMTLLAGCSGTGEASTAQTSAVVSASDETIPTAVEAEPSDSVDVEDPSAAETSVTATAGTNTLTLPETDETLYPLDDGSHVLTFWYGSWENDYLSGIEDLWVVQEAEDYTGVKVEYSTCSRTSETEATNLMYAAGSYPDMINYMGTAYKSGHVAAVEDDIYLELTDYVNQYAPNYKSLIDSNEDIRRDVLSDEGYLCGFFQISTSIQPPFQGLYVRGDWLEELGLDAPQTYDELHDVMVAFQDNFGTTFRYYNR